MVVGYAHFMRFTRCPTEHKPPLIVDADAVVPPQVAPQGFQAVPRWRGQVLQNLRGVNLTMSSFRTATETISAGNPRAAFDFRPWYRSSVARSPKDAITSALFGPALYWIHGYRVDVSPVRRTLAFSGRSEQREPRLVEAACSTSPTARRGSASPSTRASPSAATRRPLRDRSHVFSLRSRTHDGCLHTARKVASKMARRFPFGDILDGAIRRFAVCYAVV